MDGEIRLLCFTYRFHSGKLVQNLGLPILVLSNCFHKDCPIIRLDDRLRAKNLFRFVRWIIAWNKDRLAKLCAVQRNPSANYKLGSSEDLLNRSRVLADIC